MDFKIYVFFIICILCTSVNTNFIFEINFELNLSKPKPKKKKTELKLSTLFKTGYIHKMYSIVDGTFKSGWH